MSVLVTRRIPRPALSMLREALGPPKGEVVLLSDEEVPSRRDLLAAAEGRDALVTLLSDPVDAELMTAAGDGLKVVANYAVGFDNIDVAWATEHGIAVANTPDVLTHATAEVAAALLLAVARHVLEGDRMMRAGEFTGWSPLLLRGVELHGKTAGLVGGGRIARAFGRIARGFGMDLVYTNRSPKPGFEAETGARKVELDELLAVSDVISLHMPLMPATRHQIDRAAIGKMKPGVILINTARGPVVDEAALVDALRDGRIAGAGLDVYEFEPAMVEGLAELPNAVLLPHLGSATVEARAAMARMTAQAVIDVLAGRQPANLVNPQVWDRRRGA